MSYKQTKEIKYRSCFGCAAKNNIPLCIDLNGGKFGRCYNDRIIFVKVIENEKK